MQSNVRLTLVTWLLLNSIPALAAPLFTNSLEIPGNSVDRAAGSGVNVNRLGMFSDLFYDRSSNLFYGLSDRGPGGGLISYGTRVQQFQLNVSSTTGVISGFNVTNTIQFQTQNGMPFNGLNPELLSGNVANLGLSFDPEGFAVAPNGNFYVSDEYGPSVYEFGRDGRFIRAFEQPSNVLPRDANGPNFSGTVTIGRQDNRGYEGLTLSPDGAKLYAILQDPLQNEGTPNGRSSQNLRIVEFDTATGRSTGQYAYQLESVADINTRVATDFGATAQGRNIGASSITALGNNRFLIIERDNRGRGVDPSLDPTLGDVGSKHVYLIDITGATDISQLNLTGTNSLPPGVTPVSKSLYLDVQAALQIAGLPVAEKMEGLTIGPQLANGNYLLLIGTDNDYSVTQSGAGTQFDVCVNGAGVGTQVALDSGCPAGTNLIPGYLYAFSADVLNYVSPATVPEPSAWMLGGTGLLVWCLVRRSRTPGRRA
jgi:hypothetical protein